MIKQLKYELLQALQIGELARERNKNDCDNFDPDYEVEIECIVSAIKKLNDIDVDKLFADDSAQRKFSDSVLAAGFKLTADILNSQTDNLKYLNKDEVGRLITQWCMKIEVARDEFKIAHQVSTKN